MSRVSSSSDIVSVRRRESGHRVKVDSHVGRDLLSKGHTKKSIIDILKVLTDAGMIKDIQGEGADVTNLKRKLTEMSTEHGKAKTPYGILIQRVKLDAEGLTYWEYMNPFACLYYLCSLSSSFASMMRSICGDDISPLRIVIYADGLVPGNPFRPEVSRKLQCMYRFWQIGSNMFFNAHLRGLYSAL